MEKIQPKIWEKRKKLSKSVSGYYKTKKNQKKSTTKPLGQGGENLSGPTTKKKNCVSSLREGLITQTPTVVSSAIRFIELKIIIHIMYIVRITSCSLLAVIQW